MNEAELQAETKAEPKKAAKKTEKTETPGKKFIVQLMSDGHPALEIEAPDYNTAKQLYAEKRGSSKTEHEIRCEEAK